MSKFLSNKILIILVLAIFISNWYCLLTRANISYIHSINWIVNILCLHYMFTTVHQSSHGLLSKNKYINYCFGFISTLLAGITFADFKFTHDLHHKHIGNKNRDPDHMISGSGPILLIPFKIFYHDYYFIKNNKSIFEYISYFFERIIQISIVLLLFLDKPFLFSTFWLVPMLVIGVMNALFLFYFPHYKHWIESTKYNFSPLKSSIQMSREYHHKHHDDPSLNSNFYPFEISVLSMLKKESTVNYDSSKDYFYSR